MKKLFGFLAKISLIISIAFCFGGIATASPNHTTEAATSNANTQVQFNKENTDKFIYAIKGNMPQKALKIAENKKGINFNGKDNAGYTALMYATYIKSTELVKLLIEKKVNLNEVNKMDETALIMAASSGHTGIAKLLIDAGADINLKNEYGQTALSFAKDNNNDKLIQFIEAAQSKKNQEDSTAEQQ